MQTLGMNNPLSAVMLSSQLIIFYKLKCFLLATSTSKKLEHGFCLAVIYNFIWLPSLNPWNEMSVLGHNSSYTDKNLDDNKIFL